MLNKKQSHIPDPVSTEAESRSANQIESPAAVGVSNPTPARPSWREIDNCPRLKRLSEPASTQVLPVQTEVPVLVEQSGKKKQKKKKVKKQVGEPTSAKTRTDYLLPQEGIVLKTPKHYSKKKSSFKGKGKEIQAVSSSPGSDLGSSSSSSSSEHHDDSDSDSSSDGNTQQVDNSQFTKVLTKKERQQEKRSLGSRSKHNNRSNECGLIFLEY
ncbi:unnamed protein product [Arabis nemorensis]|uniref:Uncharacterized protein n=1 Tax=Arabis nemorensis TaxID=586526 RepID=A0A565CRF1_9BRAS|nr:unnamed protein product [Arabis nemorensis]